MTVVMVVVFFPFRILVEGNIGLDIRAARSQIVHIELLQVPGLIETAPQLRVIARRDQRHQRLQITRLHSPVRRITLLSSTVPVGLIPS